MDDYDELDEMVDELLAYLASLPPPAVTMLNPARYQAMMNSAQKLKELLTRNYMEGQIQCSVDKHHLFGTVTVEMIDLSVTTIPLFLATIEEADAVEIYPLVNGNIRFEITFQEVLKAVC